MIALAAAISVDYNFFSQHSSTGGGIRLTLTQAPVVTDPPSGLPRTRAGGLISPPLFMPMPLPGGTGEAAAGAEAADGGEAAAGGAPAGAGR